MSRAYFDSLLSMDKWTATQHFVVGAIIFWKLADVNLGSFHPTKSPLVMLSEDGNVPIPFLIYLPASD